MSADLNFGGIEAGEIELDFEGIAENSFGPIPEGKYLMKVIEVSRDVTATAGDPVIKLVLALDVEPNDPLASKKVYENLACVPPRNGKQGSMWKVRQVLEAITGTKIGQGAVKLPTRELIGRRVWCTLVIDEYEAKVDKMNPESKTVTRYTNNVEQWETDVDSFPVENITITGNLQNT